MQTFPSHDIFEIIPYIENDSLCEHDCNRSYENSCWQALYAVDQWPLVGPQTPGLFFPSALQSSVHLLQPVELDISLVPRGLRYLPVMEEVESAPARKNAKR